MGSSAIGGCVLLFTGALAAQQAPSAPEAPPAPGAGATAARRDPFEEWERATRWHLNVGGPAGANDLTAHFGGRFALDFVRWDRRNSNSSGVEFGALRPLFELDVGGRSQFRWELDLDDVDSKRGAFDLWLRQEIGRDLAVQLGQVRVAMGSEYATREENLPFVGYSFTSYLTGRYDLGLRATVDPDPALHLEGVATIGSGFGLEGEGKDDPFFMGRATLEPLRARGPELLRGFFVGAAVAWQPAFHDELELATPHQTPVFAAPDFRADHATWGLLEAGWCYGRFRAGIEGVRGVLANVDVPGGSHHDVDQLFAWTASASVFLTGDAPQWGAGRWLPHRARKGRAPAWDEDGDRGTLRLRPLETPIELALRYSNADLDRSLFEKGLTSYDPSTQEVRTASANLVFHLARGTRFHLGVVRTLADDDLSVFGGRNRDTSFLARIEIDF